MVNRLLLLALIFVLGCSVFKTYSVDRVGKRTEISYADCKEYVMEAILLGAQRRKWTVVDQKDGVITLKLIVKRVKDVTVEAKYDDSSYELTYKSSTNMGYDPTRNSIDRSYIRWVSILNKDILYAARVINKELSKGGGPASIHAARERHRLEYIAELNAKWRGKAYKQLCDQIGPADKVETQTGAKMVIYEKRIDKTFTYSSFSSFISGSSSVGMTAWNNNLVSGSGGFYGHSSGFSYGSTTRTTRVMKLWFVLDENNVITDVGFNIRN